ncbi:MAG: ribosomal protein S18-alanine N-acetyltransferase [Magnetococcales bacterium]|nr:ribosomal protein S18-alanine N-acetyltransferase [Magnetococcales bacterium]
MIFRSMVETDLAAVTRLDQIANPRPWTDSMFREELRLNSFNRVVLNDRMELLAFMIARRFHDEWHLLAIKVDPDARGQGIARSLLSELVEHARQSKARALILEVRSSNHPARNLYARLGFQEIGIRKGYYPDLVGPEDAVVMERQTRTLDTFNPF